MTSHHISGTFLRTLIPVKEKRIDTQTIRGYHKPPRETKIEQYRWE